VAGRAYVGTSGWSYPHWRGTFYPRELPASLELAYLAAHFPTVEVNGTFYSLATPATFARWREATVPGFFFAVKGSRYITHLLKLGGGEAPLANFFAQGVLLLGEQLGPILWQLPPRLRFDGVRARAFLGALPRTLREAERLARKHDARLDGRAAITAPDGRDRPLRHALEVRDSSWLEPEPLRLLARHGVALVAADTAGRYPLALAATADFAYLRLHGSRVLYGSRYTDGELDRWAGEAQRLLARGGDTWIYFDNDREAFAPGDALRLIARLGERAAAALPPP
jgi:uncharacterized protein YecE (DUF72 family)